MTESNKVNNLEKDVAKIQVVLEKIDQSVDKLTSISSDVTQLLAVREVRMTSTDKKVEELDKKVEDLMLLPPMSAHDIYELVEKTKKEFVEELEELKDELLTKNTETYKKVSTLERYMWVSMGVASALAILSSKLGSAIGSIISLL